MRERDLQRNRAEALLIRASIGDLAAQVAHDIRSPLAALKIVTQQSQSFDPNHKALITEATSRIQYIADHLLKRYREPSLSDQESPLTYEHVLSLIDTLVNEKRFEASKNSPLSIVHEYSPEAYPLFFKVIKGEFLRMLSNLINNAIEASPTGIATSQHIRVVTQARNDTLCIQIIDYGKGIAPENISHITTLGGTRDKPNGVGLGLYHASTLCKSWGGSLEITSQLGQGAQIQLNLMRVNPPETFAATLPLSSVKQVIIVDDDVATRNAWTLKLENTSFRLPVTGYPSLSSLTSAHLSSEPTLLILDQDFGVGIPTGLDWLHSHREHWKHCFVILSTSHASDPNIQNQCTTLGVRLMDKRWISIIPSV